MATMHEGDKRKKYIYNEKWKENKKRKKGNIWKFEIKFKKVSKSLL